MSSMTFFFLFVSILALVFLLVNLILAPHNPYQEKYSIFECGFHSFLGQNRTQFGVKFFIFALVYLLLDLEILLTFPYGLSAHRNNIYGLVVVLLFILIITIGFVFELGKSALKIDSRQYIALFKVKSSNVTEFIGDFSSGKEGKNMNLNQIRFINKFNRNSKFKSSIFTKARCRIDISKVKLVTFYSTNKPQIQNNINLIFSYLDIANLYLISKTFVRENLKKMLYILAILYIISLLYNWDGMENYYSSPGAVLPIFSMLLYFLVSKDFESIKETVISTMYLILNISIICLTFSLFFWGILYMCDYNLSFQEIFKFVRNILTTILVLKLIFSVILSIYSKWGNSKEILYYSVSLFISLMSIAFFYGLLEVILGAVTLLISDLEKESKVIDKKPESDTSIKKISSDTSIKKISSYTNIKETSSNSSLNHHISHNYPIVIGAKGPYLIKADGTKIFDAASGAGVSCIGGGDIRVINAMMEVLNSGNSYLASSYWKNQSSIELCKFLVESTEGKLSKVYLTTSGSDAVEAGIKLSTQHHWANDPNNERDIIISRETSYHGNTTMALSVSKHDLRQGPYHNILNNSVEHISSCNTYRQQLEGESDAEFIAKKAAELENLILDKGAEKINCFIAETVSGAALGCSVPPKGYFKAMQDICHKYNIIFILDEVMSGMGRTGTLHAWMAEEGVVPDILIIGKGLGAGYYPISAVMAQEFVVSEIESKNQQFIHGLTHDSSPLGAVAALKVQQIIKDEGLVENAKELGVYLENQLKLKLKDHPNVGDIRGKGLFFGVELVKDQNTKEPFRLEEGIAKKVVDTAKSPPYNMTFYSGTGSADGLNGDHIMIQPPYNITSKDIDHIVEVLSAVLEEVFKKKS